MTQYLITTFTDSTGQTFTGVTKARYNQTFTFVLAEIEPLMTKVTRFLGIEHTCMYISLLTEESNLLEYQQFESYIDVDDEILGNLQDIMYNIVSVDNWRESFEEAKNKKP
uniref:DUF1381 domain-containing protein n=1 Tax=Staphylococcus sp. MI 10-1553 TaxID=1912064 RepID=UPI001EF067BA|nr:DUF1381 domain-containing protein [Staphylococcus sp. MI 10-1553]